MHVEPPAKFIAAVLGLSSFATATLAGMIAGNPGTVTLLRAIPCTLAGYLLGWAVGKAAQTAAREYIDRYKLLHPIPEPSRPPELEVDDSVEVRVVGQGPRSA